MATLLRTLRRKPIDIPKPWDPEFLVWKPDMWCDQLSDFVLFTAHPAWPRFKQANIHSINPSDWGKASTVSLKDRLWLLAAQCPQPDYKSWKP